MAKDKITDYSATAASNEDVGGVAITGGSSIRLGNDAFQEIMSHLAETNAGTYPVDDTWTFADPADRTKRARIDAGSVTAGQTRVITMGDADVTLRPQAWELIETATPSGASEYAKTGLSAYRIVRIHGTLTVSVDAAAIALRTSTDNGSNYDSGASDYAYQVHQGAGTTVANSRATDSALPVSMAAGAGADTGEGISFEITLYNFNQAAYMHMKGEVTLINQSGNVSSGTLGGRRLQATARDAFRFAPSSGNISGFIVVEGIRG